MRKYYHFETAFRTLKDELKIFYKKITYITSCAVVLDVGILKFYVIMMNLLKLIYGLQIIQLLSLEPSDESLKIKTKHPKGCRSK